MTLTISETAGVKAHASMNSSYMADSPEEAVMWSWFRLWRQNQSVFNRVSGPNAVEADDMTRCITNELRPYTNKVWCVLMTHDGHEYVRFKAADDGCVNQGMQLADAWLDDGGWYHEG